MREETVRRRRQGRAKKGQGRDKEPEYTCKKKIIEKREEEKHLTLWARQVEWEGARQTSRNS